MKRTLREGLGIVLVSAGLALATFLFHPRSPSLVLVEETTRWDIPVEKIEEVLGADAGRVFWVDSRPDDHFEKGHIEGALLLNKEGWAEQVMGNQDLLQEALGRPVIVYCDGRGCQRSKEIAERLRQLIGLEPVYVLKGDWRKLP